MVDFIGTTENWSHYGNSTTGHMTRPKKSTGYPGPKANFEFEHKIQNQLLSFGVLSIYEKLSPWHEHDVFLSEGTIVCLTLNLESTI